jgi:hypothetical protein
MFVRNLGRVSSLGLVLLASLAVAQKPDLHAGGASPSSLPNHETTKVTLPGFHLAGATLTVSGACSLVSYTAAENQIVMSLKGERTVADHDGNCNLMVKNAAGTASTWVIVELTDEEQQQANAAERTADQKKAQQVVARSGSEWTLHFASGETATYAVKPSTEPGVPLFGDGSGQEFKILVANDGTVLILNSESGCYRSGKLVQGRVADGISGPGCQPAGAWTATMR